MKRRRPAPAPPAPVVDVSNVMVRLDAIVDRLEGVYDRLVPVMEARLASRQVPSAAKGTSGDENA